MFFTNPLSFKVYMTDFFYLLVRIFMMFSYENRKNKFAIDFSSSRLRRTNTCNFTSGWVQNRARRETGDSGPVTSIQQHCFRGIQCFCFSKEEHMVLRCVVYGCSVKKDEKKGIYIHQIPFYGDTRSAAVKRRRKWIFVLDTGPRASIRWCARCIAKKISLARILSTNSAIRND